MSAKVYIKYLVAIHSKQYPPLLVELSPCPRDTDCPPLQMDYLQRWFPFK